METKTRSGIRTTPSMTNRQQSSVRPAIVAASDREQSFARSLMLGRALPAVAIAIAFLVCGTLSAAPISAAAEENGSFLWLIVFALVAVAFSFLCSVAEAVLLSVTPSHIAMLKDSGKHAAESLEKLKENIDRPLAAILSLNTIAHTVGAAGVGAQAAGIWGSEAVGWASAVMTLMILVFSEIIPKTLGALYWRELAPSVAALVRGLILVLYPLVLLSDLLTRLIGGGKQEVVTREEVAAMASLSEQKGQLEQRESRILNNLFRLRSLTAHDIMTPRPVVLAFSEDMTVGEIESSEVGKLPVSRIPIYNGSIDQVTGFVLKTDILLALAKDKHDTVLREMKRNLKAVAANMNLSVLFEVLLEQHGHIALVLDEYGGTDGLVTMEDLMETLLGMEIVDEADDAIDMQHRARVQWEQRAEKMGLDISPLKQFGEAEDAESDSPHTASESSDLADVTADSERRIQPAER